MDAESRAGRSVGAVILIQMSFGVVLNFVLEAPLFGAPGFLVNASLHSRQIGLAALLGLITEAWWVGIAITVLPCGYRHSRVMTLWLASLATVVLAVAVVENAAVMAMVSLSEAYAKASPVDRGQLEAIRIVVASARNWPHFLARMLDGCTIFAFYAVLYQSVLVPRVLARFGHNVAFLLLAPLGLVQLILAVWLLAKGFRRGPLVET